MNYYSIPNFFASAIILSLGVFVALQTRGKWNERVLSFVAFCFLTSLWQFTYGLAYNAPDAESAIALMRIGYSGVVFMPVTYLHFAASFLKKGRLKVPIRIYYLFSIFFLATLYINHLFIQGSYQYFFGFYPKTFPPIHIPFLAVIAISNQGSVFMLYREWRRIEKQGYTNTEGTDIHQIKLVCFAYLLMAVVVADFLPNYGLEIYPFGFIFVILYSLVITYTILRYNLHDIQVIIKRTLQFAGLVTSMLVVVSLVAFVSQELLSRYVVIPKWLSNAFAIAIIVVLYEPLRNWLTNVTEKYLFQKKYDYRELLKKFTDEARMQLNLNALQSMTVRTLTDLMKLENCSLLLVNKDTRQYELVASQGTKAQQLALEETGPFITFLHETHEPVDLDGALKKVEYPESMLATMDRLKAREALPMEVHEELIGVLCLGKKKSDEHFSKEDLDVLEPIANTLGIAVSNAQAVVELQKAYAETAQSEKLAVIGTLSAGINHEICNPLGIVKAQCEAFLLDQQDGILIGKSAQEVLDRTATIMQVALKQIDRATAITQKLSNFAKPIKESTVQAVSVGQEIDEVLLLVGHDLALDKIEVMREIDPNLPPIQADRRQLQEVLFNLVRNAGQAIKPPGTVWVRAYIGNDRFVRIEIEDTGSGIPPDKLGKIYDPFFTTKEPGKGTGLGLFIVKQIIERNKGRISVESTVGKGTIFFLEFPIPKAVPVAV